MDYDRALPDHVLTTYRDLVRRAGEHEPIAYLTGKGHFFGLEFEVNRQVLIPRPETETLVENVLQFVRATPGLEAPRVLDLCTGSGCIAAAIATRLKAAVVVAGDLSAPAVELAQANMRRLGLAERVLVFQGDLFDAIEGSVDQQPFDMIVANPPYIPSGQIAGLDRGVREYEPTAALDGGLDGLAIHRRILDGAAERLTLAGRLYLEIAFDQGEAALSLLGTRNDYTEGRLLKDLGGRDRVLTARRAPK